MRKIFLAVIAVAGLLFSGSLVAQNLMADPLYGTHALNTGFTPDPFGVSVMAGGSTDAATLGITDPTGGPCRGQIAAEQPDVRLNFTTSAPGSQSFPLRFYVQAAADTTLLVNLPDATWRCNDDHTGLNPVIDIPLNQVQSGQYDVWIGTYNPGEPQQAMLYVTELTSNGPTP